MWPGREARQRKVVLEALEAVGDVGMSPNTLAVTTQLPEQRLEATLQRLVDTGLVDRRVERHPTGLRITRPRYRLATDHASRA
jgi:DNA-binding IclR family transcriptional regulator